MLVNVGHPSAPTTLERVLGATLEEVFATVVRDPSQDVNTILLASDAPVSAAALLRGRPALPADLRPVALAAAERLAPALPGGRSTPTTARRSSG